MRMKVTERPLRRFTVMGLRFVRRPVSDPPADGTLCVVDDGDEAGWMNGQRPAQFQHGEWTNGKGKALNFVPTFWTTLEEGANGE